MSSADGRSDAAGKLIREALDLGVVDERRKFPRRPADGIVIVQPVDEHGKPYGQSSLAECLDISAGGIALVCRKPVDARFVYLESMESDLGFQARTIEVLRVRQIGDEYEVAGIFVSLAVIST